MKHSLRSIVLSVVTLALFSCAKSERSVVHLDLLEDLPGLEKNTETRGVDLSSPGARAHLFRGFSEIAFDERRERHFVRASSARSVVKFSLLEARDLVLALQGRPVPKQSSVKVQVAVNTDVIGEIELEQKLGRYRIKLPERTLRRGENRLFLTYSGDAETVAWYRFQFSLGTPLSRLPVTNTSNRSLFLPYGSQLTVPLLAPPGAVLRFQEVGVRGGAGSVRLDIARDGAEVASFVESEAAEDRVYDLGAEEWTPVRLTLTALANGASGERDGIALVEPAIWARERYSTEAPPRPAESGARSNVLVYLVDTLRADRLGGYGNPRGLTPELDAFAERATLFEHAVANTSWTRPAVASVFSGMWPAAHGVNRTKDRLAEETETLAEVLQAAGYQNAAFVANPNAYGRFGLRQGFDVYRHMQGKKAPARVINDSVLEWLDERDGERPFFVYVHTVDPHDPYEPPEEFRSKFAPGTEEILALPKKARWLKEHRQGLSDLYDAEIASNDRAFGTLLDELEARELIDDTLIIFLSDHGEEFQEHGSWTHGHKLFEESVRIPLIVKWPGQTEGERRADLAQQIDVPSTILSAVGLEWPQAFEGRDLAARADDRPPAAFMYLNYYGPLQLGVVREQWKYMVRVDRGTTWLFDLEKDPGETEDRSPDQEVREDLFDAELGAELKPKPYWLTAGEAAIDKKLEEQLRALGYLN